MTDPEIRGIVSKASLSLVRAALSNDASQVDAAVKLVRATNVVLDQNFERMLYAMLNGKKLPPAIKGKR